MLLMIDKYVKVKMESGKCIARRSINAGPLLGKSGDSAGNGVSLGTIGIPREGTEGVN